MLGDRRLDELELDLLEPVHTRTALEERRRLERERRYRRRVDAVIVTALGVAAAAGVLAWTGAITFPV